MMERDAIEHLRDLAARYARAVDRRDADMLLSVFHPTATLTVQPPDDSEKSVLNMQGHGEIGRLTKAISRYRKTFHFLGQSTYQFGDVEATGEVYCLAHHLTQDPGRVVDHVMCIRYQDRYLPEAGEWKIQSREVLIDWTETRPADASWADADE